MDAANAVAVDGSGDVVAAGFTGNETVGSDFTVVKLAATTGQQQWRQVIAGYAHVFDEARAATVDAAGNVVAVGTMHMVKGFDFAVVKLRGSDGEILWRQVIDGSQVKLPPSHSSQLGPDDEAFDVVTDSSGDVIAAGLLGSFNFSNGRFFVIKFRGSDGTELWHYVVGDEFDPGQANAVTVDRNGDAIVAGFTTDFLRLLHPGHLLTVVKLDGASGAELWQGNVSGGQYRDAEAQSVALTPEDDVVAAGSVSGEPHLIVRFRGSDGSVAWQYGASDQVQTVAVAPAGAVVGAGGAIFALNATDGTQIWYRSVDVLFQATTTDLNGDVLAGGYSSSRNVFKLAAGTGADLWPAAAVSDAQLAVKALAVDTAGDVAVAGERGVVVGSETFSDFVVAKLNGRDGGSFGVPSCAGDCNHDGRVGVDELVNGVNIALGAATVCTCSSFDGDHDRKVTVDELVAAVNAALNGCGA